MSQEWNAGPAFRAFLHSTCDKSYNLAMRAQTRFDIAQALAISQSRERQAKKLFQTSKTLDLVLAVVPSRATPKSAQQQLIGHLRENQLVRMHDRVPQKLFSQEHGTGFLS